MRAGDGATWGDSNGKGRSGILADCPSGSSRGAAGARGPHRTPIHRDPIPGMDHIRIRGARTHNLRNVNLDIPRDRLVVITGLSGSGKSSLAFDTLYAEGQRRYVESLSAYARQFLQLMEKPDVDLIEGLSPGDLDRAEGDLAQPALDRGHGHRDPRLPAPALRARRRAALPGARAGARRAERLADGRPRARPAGGHARHGAGPARGRPQGRAGRALRGAARAGLRAPAHRRRGARDRPAAEARPQPQAHGRDRGRPPEGPAPTRKQRLAESFETALRHADGRALAVEMDSGQASTSSRRSSPARSAAISIPELEPRLFSFNNPMGACPRCDGLGQVTFFDPKRVVAFPHLSLAGGAIRGWDRRNQFYFSMLVSLAQHYGFDVETPFENLPGARAGRRALRLGRGEDRLPLSRRARQVGGARARLRGDPAQPRAPLPRDRLGRGEGGARQVPQHPRLPGLRRHAAAPRGAPRARRRPHDPRGLGDAAQGRAALLRDAGAARATGRRSPRRSCARSPTACTS